MSDTQQTENCMKPGEIGWNELTTSDPAGAIQFYSELFGWETQKFPESEMDYTMFTHGGKPFGGVLKPQHPGTPTMWINYVVVEDVDATVAKCTSLGGKTCLPPMDIPTVGRVAIIADPQGATVGLHQPPKK